MSEKRCIQCGHTAEDHVEGYMGARVGVDYLCHQDDHSCYAPTRTRPPGKATAPFGDLEIDEMAPGEFEALPCHRDFDICDTHFQAWPCRSVGTTERTAP